MSQKTKLILTIFISLLYVALTILFAYNLPVIMSGGNESVKSLLMSGQVEPVYKYPVSDIGFAVKKGDIIYVETNSLGEFEYTVEMTENTFDSYEVKSVDKNYVEVKSLSEQKGKFNFGIVPFQILIGILMIMIPIIIAFRTDAFSFLLPGGAIGSGRAKKKYGDQGSAKIGNLSELKQFMGKDGFTISKNFRLSGKASYEHALIMGPTGSGKSTCFFIPNVLDMDGSHSFIVTDPKKEMCDISRAYLESMGYDVVVIAPTNRDYNEFKYNPLLLTEDDKDIHEIAQIILINGGKSVEMSTGGGGGMSEWINMSVPLLAAAFAYVKYHGVKKSIPEALDIILQDDLKEMERKFKQNEFAYRQFLIFKASAESEKTLASIKSVLASNVQLFLSGDLIRDFVTPDFKADEYGIPTINTDTLFDPRRLRERPTALFLCIPETESLYMMPLVSVLYYQLLNLTMKHHKGCPILCFFDEFPNSGRIIGLETIISTCRSRRIGISICTQGIEQLEKVYGKEVCQTLLNNLKTKLIFAGLTGESAKYISDLSGFTTVESKNYSSGGGGKTSILSGRQVSKSGVKRELLTADEIRRMDQTKVLIISQNASPVFDVKNTYYTQKKYTAKATKI